MPLSIRGIDDIWGGEIFHFMCTSALSYILTTRFKMEIFLGVVGCCCCPPWSKAALLFFSFPAHGTLGLLPSYPLSRSDSTDMSLGLGPLVHSAGRTRGSGSCWQNRGSREQRQLGLGGGQRDPDLIQSFSPEVTSNWVMVKSFKRNSFPRFPVLMLPFLLSPQHLQTSFTLFLLTTKHPRKKTPLRFWESLLCGLEQTNNLSESISSSL